MVDVLKSSLHETFIANSTVDEQHDVENQQVLLQGSVCLDCFLFSDMCLEMGWRGINKDGR